MTTKDRTVTVRMRPLAENGVTVWEFDGTPRGGIAGGYVWGADEVRSLAADICEMYDDFAPEHPAYNVKFDGQDWIVDVSELVEVPDDEA